MKIAITTSTFGKYDNNVLKPIEKRGWKIKLNPSGRRLRTEELYDFYNPEIDGIIAGTENISKDILSRADNLKVISRCGIGLDNIDLDCAHKSKIQIYNTVDPVVEAVGELTVGLIFSLLRNIVICHSELKGGIWQKRMGKIFKGKTLGIIGLGNIGKRVVELTNSFGLKVLVYDMKEDIDFAGKFSIKYTDLDTLLTKSDIVSVHLPLNKYTRGFLNRGKLSLLKPGSFLINTSRGGIIDEEVLLDTLKQRKISGAALDVFENEPYRGRLLELDNVILTPHIGSYARESRIEMERQSVANLIKGLRKG